MKLNQNFFIALATAAFFIGSVSILSSCVKERDFDTYAAEDASYAMWIYDDAINILNEASRLKTGDNLILYKTTGYCSEVVNQPGRIIVSFGSSDCLCNDGRNRRGKIIVEFQGNYADSGQAHFITFEDYFVDNNEVNGSETVTFMGRNDANQPYFTVSVDGILDIDDSLGSLTYNAELERTWLTGSETIQYEDDNFEITGKGQGVNIYGNNYAFNTKESVHKPTNLMCRYFTKGILEVQPQGRTFRSIDFGNGNCDKTATVTIDGKQHNMILK